MSDNTGGQPAPGTHDEAAAARGELESGTPSDAQRGQRIWIIVGAVIVALLLLIGIVWAVQARRTPAPVALAPIATTTPSAEASPPPASSTEASQPPMSTTTAATTVLVPSVVGMSQAAAETQLNSVGFSSVVAHVITTAKPAGTVVSQLPAAGTKLIKGSVVAIDVAEAVAPKPPSSASVPNVIGMTQSAAQSKLSAAGLTPAFVTQANSAANGTAFAQEPVGGTTVQPGTAVIVSISTGTPPPPANIAVPSVVGKTQSEAQSAISAAKLTDKVVDTFSDSVPKGKVTDQAPPAGSKVAPGTTVTIVVSLGPKPTAPTNVTVPDLHGKTEEQATQALADLELLAEAITVPDPEVPAGEVIGQMPAAGTHVPQGTLVLIEVAGPGVVPY